MNEAEKLVANNYGVPPAERSKAKPKWMYAQLGTCQCKGCKRSRSSVPLLYKRPYDEKLLKKS